jgi:hypothetical protein
MDKFSKVAMVVIILLLAMIALHPFISLPRAIAAEHYKYLVVSTGVDDLSMQKDLDKRVAEGWELAAPVVSEQVSGVTLIFRKESD